MVGKRLGRNRWSPSNPKTGEGSIAFTISVVLSALFLRLLGLTEEFSVSVFHTPGLLACGVPWSARSSSTLLMAVILGFQVQWCRRTFLAAGGILRAKRQSSITCISMEHGRAGCSVGILKGRPVGDFKLQGMTSVVPEGQWTGEGRFVACLWFGNRSRNSESDVHPPFPSFPSPVIFSFICCLYSPPWLSTSYALLSMPS